MKTITHHVRGKLLVEEGRTALFLKNDTPAMKTAESLYLRYAFILRETETRVFPALLLDDWGGEIRGLELYDWIKEFGDQFPRAEMFGYDLEGREIQCFLRELELYTRLRCYVYAVAEMPINQGKRLDLVLIPDEGVATANKIKLPNEIKQPLRSAKVIWWSVNPQLRDWVRVFD